MTVLTDGRTSSAQMERPLHEARPAPHSTNRVPSSLEVAKAISSVWAFDSINPIQPIRPHHCLADVPRLAHDV